jgi:hypothetical protein
MQAVLSQLLLVQMLHVLKHINENAALYPDPNKDLNVFLCFTEAT